MATVWILNLDAEFEMAQPKGYSPSAAELRGVERGVERALRSFASGSTVVTLDEVRSGEHEGAKAHAWCATPRVRDACERGGVRLELCCDYEAIRAVNNRRFCASLEQDFPSSEFIRPSSLAVGEVRDKLQSENRNWLLKRAYGVAGRGQRRIRGSEVQHADVAWIQASLRTAGLQVEPYVSIVAEFSLHGIIEPSGEFQLGRPCLVEQESGGQFRAAHVASTEELSSFEREQLKTTGRRVAQALVRRGYFGPFGIDAFRWTDEHGETHFRSLSEINARYTMGWTVGMWHVETDSDLGAAR